MLRLVSGLIIQNTLAEVEHVLIWAMRIAFRDDVFDDAQAHVPYAGRP